MASDKENGVGIVTLQAAGWSKSDGASKFKLQYSTDGGSTWADAGEVEIAAPTYTTQTSADYKEYSFTVNKEGRVRIRIQQTAGKRVRFDNIALSNYRKVNGAEDVVFGDERGTGWDAWCENGLLVVDLSQNAEVAVHGVDGVTYVSARFNEGRSEVSLVPGLYVVVVGESSRRVLVK